MLTFGIGLIVIFKNANYHIFISDMIFMSKLEQYIVYEHVKGYLASA